MKRLAEFVISTLDLVDAQVRQVADTGRRTARDATLSLTFSLIVLLGAGLLLASMVIALGPHLGYAGATSLAGILALCVGGIGMWIQRWPNR